MIAPEIPKDEITRLKDVYNTHLLDTPEEKEFNEIVQLASDLCDMPISLITLLDADRQWFKARVGLDARETTRDISFCGHAILQDDIFIVPDALADTRFSDNPLVVHGPEIRFYAGVPLVTESGSRLGTLCVIDRSPRVLTEKQRFALKVLAGNVIKVADLRIKNKQLHHLTETQKLIIATMSHDIRNPLTALQSIINMEEEEVIDEQDAKQMLTMVGSQLNNTIEMVDNLVSWGKVQMSNQVMKPELVNLRELMDQLFAHEFIGANPKNNKLINDVPSDVHLGTDRQVLKFILRNLLSNATKFTENGSIKVSASACDTHTEIIITDTGVGIAPEKVGELFGQSFKTFTTLGTKKEKGSGLGLMLVKEFIVQLHGTIRVESHPGLGTTFTMVFQH
jgi:signal transduction histidine kinase